MQLAKFIFLSLGLLSLKIYGANNKFIDEYHQNVFIGEQKTGNYSGPIDPRSMYSDTKGSLIFLDDIFNANYLNQHIQPDIFELHQYWFDKVVEKSNCPDSVLNENMEYIRYLYRLVSISYLFESLKLNTSLAQGLGGENICAITYKEVFSQCSTDTSVSTDMKKFHQRISGKFQNEIDKIKFPKFSKKETEGWLQDFHQLTLNGPITSRLYEWCEKNNKDCSSIALNEIKDNLKNFCEEDTKNIVELCSEKDSYYGLSSISTATDLIRSSNAFNLINQSGMGEECLHRYGKLFRNKELAYPVLKNQFPLIFSYLFKNNHRYLQGELFLPGALKEFDMKGLSDFLTGLKPAKPAPEMVKAKIKPASKPMPKPIVMLPTPEPKIDPIVAVPPEIKPEPIKPFVSEFERVVIERDEKKLDSLAVEMNAFRDDFEFTAAMVAELSEPIRNFQTRATITAMKKFDHLGQVEAPVGLAFLKFLIDTENHQGLYNIITILGDKFYAKNDIEKKTQAHYIQLKNDALTGNKWQIILLRNP